jgi:hypothetical protein
VEYRATAVIDADAQRIWSILTDGPSYAEWDSGLVRLEGHVAPGQKLKLYPEINPDRGFPVKVTGFEPARSMTWAGGMPLGLFKGVRTFTLTPAGDGATRFQMRERFGGPLLPLIGRTLPDFGPSFDQFARGLKARAEGG